MANHLSALKRARQTTKRTATNRANTSSLRTQLPGLQLTATNTTTLSGNPAVQLMFTDSSASPPTTVEQVAGRTLDDRPLTVTVTVPDPRYAPNDLALRDFLASIVS